MRAAAEPCGERLRIEHDIRHEVAVVRLVGLWLFGSALREQVLPSPFVPRYLGAIQFLHGVAQIGELFRRVESTKLRHRQKFERRSHALSFHLISHGQCRRRLTSCSSRPYTSISPVTDRT